MDTASVSTCPLCGRPMETAGNHQISSLACGHLFGYECINNNYLTDPNCPICQKRIFQNDIKYLFWGKTSEVSRTEINKLLVENEKMKDEIDELNTDSNRMEKQIKSREKELTQRNTKREKIFIEQHVIRNSALIFERKLTDGFRICTNERIIIASNKLNDKYGLEVSSFSDLPNFSFIPCHKLQIRDIAYKNNMIASVSHDKHLIITTGDSPRVLSSTIQDVPLWSTMWFDQNVVFAGGNLGHINGYDTRSNLDTFKISLNGPPINSLVPFNSEIFIAVSTQKSHFIDTRTMKEIYINNSIQGGICMHKSYDSPVFILSSKYEDKISNNVFTIDKGKNFQTIKEIKTKSYQFSARVAISSIGKFNYCAIPDESQRFFSLRVCNQLENDIMATWKNKWRNFSFPEPVIDLSFSVNDTAFISAASQTRLRIYSLPIDTCVT